MNSKFNSEKPQEMIPNGQNSSQRSGISERRRARTGKQARKKFKTRIRRSADGVNT